MLKALPPFHSNRGCAPPYLSTAPNALRILQKVNCKMQFPKLTPLQSRFLACLGTSILLVIIYYSLSPTHFAYAAELESTLNEDHNHHRIYHDLDLSNDIDWGKDDNEDFDKYAPSYQAEFGFTHDRSIIGRAASGTFALANNVPTTSNIEAGEMQSFVFDNSSLWSNFSPDENGLPANLSAFGADISATELSKRSLPLDELDYLDDDFIDEGDEEEPLELQGVNVKRQSGATRTVYVVVNTVLQPTANGSFSGNMPQCTLFLSTTTQSPDADTPDVIEVELVEGYALKAVEAIDNVFISVQAPPQSALSGLSGGWNYAVVASIDGPFYGFNETSNGIYPVDTDSTTGLIATFNLTSDNSTDNATSALRQQFLASPPPFELFVFNASDPRINGVQNSYAAMLKIDMGPINVSSSMTNRGMGGNVKEQFYVQGLQAGTTYTAILAYSSANFSQVWNPVNFTTKSGKSFFSPSLNRSIQRLTHFQDGNCKLIFGLSFCTDVAYAVPFNGTTDFTTLAALYDNSTNTTYQNFSYSLQQIPCNTTSSAQYSLARNCDDCDRDYRAWLCAVSIPRCYDFSASNTAEYSFLAPREVNNTFLNGTSPDLTQPGLNTSMASTIRFNSSRNPFIDQTIIPQPYKEVLPCQELCYELVKSCPAALQFVCPKPEWMLRRSYGEVNMTALTSNILTCNWPNVDWPVLSGAASGRVGGALKAVVVAGAVMGLMGAW